MSHFDFQKFRIKHDRCAMKVGTDGVLLGAWAKIENSKNILDIGTGSGLIAIMLAQRTNAQITGIEINEEACRQAVENAHECPFSNQINIIQADLKEFKAFQLYDNIVSNPPYFDEKTLPPESGRAAARHTQGLPLETLVNEAKRLMCPNALFQVILPYDSVSRFLGICALHELSLQHRTDICTKEGKPFKRTLLCLINNITTPQTTRTILCLTNDIGKRSEEYEKLTAEFYLH